jgi:hypothetical protein
MQEMWNKGWLQNNKCIEFFSDLGGKGGDTSGGANSRVEQFNNLGSRLEQNGYCSKYIRKRFTPEGLYEQEGADDKDVK